MPNDTINVGVRMRPLVGHEKGQVACFSLANDNVSLIPSALGNERDIKESSWHFDHAMDSSHPGDPEFVDNELCYKYMGRNIVDHALEGYNAVLFCYGQTGTGKTTTVLGDKQSGPGVLILLLRDLFEEVRKEEELGGSITVSVQMLEVYNEKVYDLLVSDEQKRRNTVIARHKSVINADAQPSIELHVLPSGVQIKGAEDHPVTTEPEVMRLIDRGNRNKHIAATAMNPQSSRGHTVFKLLIKKEEEDIHTSSEVYFADLAGHENEKTTKVQGERMVELSFINKSLMWLQSAIHSLSSPGGKKSKGGDAKAKISLFRNSKLTLLLANALTGNALINVIVTISPAAVHFPTSYSSLRFANEVKHMAVEVTSSAAVDPQAVIRRLKEEVQNLRSQLEAVTSGAPETGRRMSAMSRDLADSHHKIEELQEQLEEEKQRSEKLQEQTQRARATSRASLHSLQSSAAAGRKPTTDSVVLALESSLEEMKLSNDSLQAELLETKDQIRNLRGERAGLRRSLRTGSLSAGSFSADRSRSADLLAAEVNGSANGYPSMDGGGAGEYVFGPDVAKVLLAITSKMNELQQDLEEYRLNEEHGQISSLLDRARQLVPLDGSAARLNGAAEPSQSQGNQVRRSSSGSSSPTKRSMSPSQRRSGVFPAPPQGYSPSLYGSASQIAPMFSAQGGSISAPYYMGSMASPQYQVSPTALNQTMQNMMVPNYGPLIG
jgi:DNA polymerase III delta prime subunit